MSSLVSLSLSSPPPLPFSDSWQASDDSGSIARSISQDATSTASVSGSAADGNCDIDSEGYPVHTVHIHFKREEEEYEDEDASLSMQSGAGELEGKGMRSVHNTYYVIILEFSWCHVQYSWCHMQYPCVRTRTHARTPFLMYRCQTRLATPHQYHRWNKERDSAVALKVINTCGQTQKFPQLTFFSWPHLQLCLASLHQMLYCRIFSLISSLTVDFFVLCTGAHRVSIQLQQPHLKFLSGDHLTLR